MNRSWTEVCRVGPDFQPIHGSVAAVAAAIRRGADMRRFSTYAPQTTGLVEETMTLTTTWVIDDTHAGGLATLRQPVEAGLGFFEPPPCMAYWIFNVAAPSGEAFVPLSDQPAPKATDGWTHVANHPFTQGEDRQWLSQHYRWWANESWAQVCAHDAQGHPTQGDWRDIRTAANDGCAVKVGIRDLWSYLTPDNQSAIPHEVFIECNVQFAHVDGAYFAALTIPTLMVQPCKPLRFTGLAFAPGWLLVRSDGKVCRQTLDPSTRKWQRTWARHAIRWFVR